MFREPGASSSPAIASCGGIVGTGVGTTVGDGSSLTCGAGLPETGGAPVGIAVAAASVSCEPDAARSVGGAVCVPALGCGGDEVHAASAVVARTARSTDRRRGA